MQQNNVQLNREQDNKIQILYSRAIAQLDEAIGYLEDNHAAAREQMKHLNNEFLKMMPDELLSLDIDLLMPKNEQMYLLANPKAVKELYENKYKFILDEQNWVDDENPKTPPKRVIQQKLPTKQKQLPARKNPPLNIPSALKKELVSQQKQAYKNKFTSSSKQARFRFKE